MKKKSGSPDGARRILDAFDLEKKDLPTDLGMPYRVDNSLQLPNQLTSLEIRQIGAMSRFGHPYKKGFYLGDMSLWLRDHPDDAPMSQEQFTQMVMRSGLARRTFRYNYQSISNTFPLKERHRELSRPHHDAVRTLPRPERRRLLNQAYEEGWTDERLRKHVQLRKAGRENRSPADSAGSRKATNSLIENRKEDMSGMIDIPRKRRPRRRRLVLVDDSVYGRLKELKQESGWSMGKIIEFAVQKIRVPKS